MTEQGGKIYQTLKIYKYDKDQYQTISRSGDY